jgi:hypothetical protein
VYGAGPDPNTVHLMFLNLDLDRDLDHNLTFLGAKCLKEMIKIKMKIKIKNLK